MRSLPGATMKALTCAVALVAACTELGDPTRVDDEPPFFDASAGAPDASLYLDMSLGADGSVPAPSVEPLYADPSRPPNLGSGALDGEFAGREGAEVLAGCFDGSDADGDALVDCADPECHSALRSCCAGRADCCAAPGEAALISAPLLAGCADPASCLSAAAFGAPAPYVVDDAVAGAGDGEYDSGLLFAEEVDLRADRAELAGTFAAPATCPAGGCFESIAFGFSRQDALDERSHVEALLALVYTPARAEVSLQVEGAVVARWPAEVGPWTLQAAPTGAVVVESPTVSHSVLATFEAGDAHPVLWGHNANPSASGSPGARLTGLALRRARCDMPRAWRPGRALPLGAARSVAVAVAPEVHLALGRGTDIELFERAAGADEFTGPVESVPGREPALVVLGEELLLFALRGDDLVRAPVSELIAPVPVMPAATWATFAVAARAGEPSLVLMARTQLGDHVPYSSGDRGTTWNARPAVDLPLPQHDEEGRMALLVHDGAYVLYVALRRGTRWHLAQLASDDLVLWRLVDERALGADEELAPMGVRAPAAWSTPEGVGLIGLGWDGTDLRPFERFRPATDAALLPGE